MTESSPSTNLARRAIPQPGIWPGVSFAEYVSWDAINFHSLMHYAVSPLHAKHKMVMGDKETPSLVLGDSAHAALFDPSGFATKYLAEPDFGDCRKAYNKQTRDAWRAENARGGKILIPYEEYGNAVAIVDAIKTHRVAADIMLGEGRNELSIVWVQSGVLCKGRIDRLCQYQGQPWIWDLKSTRRPWPDAFGTEAVKFQYPAQIATYHAALNAIAPHRRRAGILAIQNEPPYEISPYYMQDGDLKRYRARFAQWLEIHKQCTAAGAWPAANPDGMDLILPTWKDRDLGDWTD